MAFTESNSPGVRRDSDHVLRRRSLGRLLVWGADLPDDLVDLLWHDPHALLLSGVTLQDKPRCTVVRLDHPAGPFVLKYHNWGGIGRTLKKSLHVSPAAKTWHDGLYLHAAGIPTPRPRAYAERRVGPFRVSSHVLMDYVPGTNLYRLMRFGRPSADLVEDLARNVAAIWQQLAELSVSHNDLKAENFIVDPQRRVWLIDLEKVRRCRDGKRLRRKHERDAAVLLHPRSWRSDPRGAEVFRQALLRTPAGVAATAGRADDAHPLRLPIAPSNCPSQLVTVLVPCTNSEAMIAGCLESVRDFADEILVADGGSTDRTLEVVRAKGGCRIIARTAVDEADLLNWAAGQARHPWILWLLPQERLHAGLGKEVQDLLTKSPAEDGFRIARRHTYWGRPIRFGELEEYAPIRLYRTGAGYCALREGRTEVVIPSGKVSCTPSPLIFETCTNIDAYIRDKLDAADRAAAYGLHGGRRPACHWLPGRLLWHFVRTYLLRGGFLDGRAGLHASCLSAVSVYLREARLWEARMVGASGIDRSHYGQPTLKLFDPHGKPMLVDVVHEDVGTQATSHDPQRTVA